MRTNKMFWERLYAEYSKDLYSLEVSVYRKQLSEGSITTEEYARLVDDAAERLEIR